jgi:hypothetical protein
MGAVGVSTGGALESHAGRSAAAGAPSPLPVDFRATLTKLNGARFHSGGHAGGRFDADVYVTPSAKGALFDPHALVPSGTVLVMEEFVHGKNDGGPMLMMEKEAAGFAPAGGDWRYVVVDGTVVSDSGLDLCASCHAEAPHDHVFAMPE